MQVFSIYPEDQAKSKLPVPYSHIRTDLPQMKSHLLSFALSVDGVEEKPIIFLEGSLPEAIQFLCHSAMLKLQDLDKGEDFVYDKLPKEWNQEAHRIITKARFEGTSQPITYKVSDTDIRRIFLDSPSLCSVFTFLLQDPKTIGALGKKNKTVTEIVFLGNDYICRNGHLQDDAGCDCVIRPVNFVCLAGECTKGSSLKSPYYSSSLCPEEDTGAFEPALPGYLQDLLGGKTGGGGQGKTKDPFQDIADFLNQSFPGAGQGQGGQATNPAKAIEDALGKYFPGGIPGTGGGQGQGQAPAPSDILAQIQAALNDALGKGKEQGALQPQLDQIVGVFTGLLASFQTAQADPPKAEPPKDPSLENAINDAFGSIFGGSGNFADSPLGRAISQALAQSQNQTKAENPNAWANPTEAVQAWLSTFITTPGGPNSDPSTPPLNPNGVTEQVTQVLQSWFPWLQQHNGSVKSLAGDVPDLTMPEWKQVITAAQGFCMQLGAVGQSMVPAGVLNIPWGQVDWNYWSKQWDQSMVGVSRFLSGLAEGRSAHVGLSGHQVGWLGGSSDGSLPFMSASEMADIGGLPGIEQVDFSNPALIEFLRSGPCRSYTAEQVLARAKQMQAECPACQADPQAALAALCSDRPVCEACQSALGALEELKKKYESVCSQNWPNPEERLARGKYIDQHCPGVYADTEAYISAMCSNTPLSEICPGGAAEEEKTPVWKYALIGAGVMIAGGLLIKAVKD